MADHGISGPGVRPCDADALLSALKAWGCDTEDAMRRMMDDRELYAELLSDYLQEVDIDGLAAAAARQDAETAFRLAHAIKGVLGNLSLTPIYRPVCAVTEVFRKGSCDGSQALLREIGERKAELDRLLRSIG